MQYQYSAKSNFEHLASGRVLLQKPGLANFPIRLAQEIYGRCVSHLHQKSGLRFYDPCGGGGYLAAILGFLNPSLGTIVCSDCDAEALDIARQNLSLLTTEGLTNRMEELQRLYARFHKESHRRAVASARKLLETVTQREHEPDVIVFQADILRPASLPRRFQANVVMTDVPYGSLTSWQGGDGNAIGRLLDHLLPILAQDAVVAICADKKQKITSDTYIRLEKQLIGKRKFEILKPHTESLTPATSPSRESSLTPPVRSSHP